LDEEIEPDSIAIIVVRWEFAENLGLFEVLSPFFKRWRCIYSEVLPTFDSQDATTCLADA
jgi:hypothetical protein